MMSRRAVMLVVGCVLLLAAGLVDAPLAGWVHRHGWGPVVKGSWLAKIVKWPGDFRFTLVVGGLILAANAKRWRGVVMVLLAGALAGLFYTLVKWTVGRTRPFPKNAPVVPPFEFHPFAKGVSGLWKAENQAFPSGHVCLAFATAAALAMIFPRGRIAFFALAALVGLERVMEGAHYPSDVVGGAIVGVLAAWVAAAIARRGWGPSGTGGRPVESIR